MFNIYFSALWLVVEGVVFLLWIRMKSHSYLDIKVTSFEGKEMHYRNLENYLILRFCKFIGTLFNFLGIVYAIKSMRCLKLLDCTIIICLINFGLAVYWLRIINEVVAFLKSNLYFLQKLSQCTIISKWICRRMKPKLKKCNDFSRRLFYKYMLSRS